MALRVEDLVAQLRKRSVFNSGDPSDTEAHCYTVGAALVTPSNVHKRSRAETVGDSGDAPVRARRQKDEQV